MERAVQILREEAGDRVRLESPTQNLERYFLAVVERARAEAQTSGATSGNQLAEFIRGDAEAAAASGARVLERLTQATKAPEPHVISAPQPAPVDTARLKALTELQPEPPPPASGQPSTFPGKPVDLSKADEKLTSLLGGKPKP
jgi:hypothetical protein